MLKSVIQKDNLNSGMTYNQEGDARVHCNDLGQERMKAYTKVEMMKHKKDDIFKKRTTGKVNTILLGT